MSADGCINATRWWPPLDCGTLDEPFEELGFDEAPKPAFSFSKRMSRYMSEPRPPNQRAAIHPYEGRRLRRVKNPNLGFARIPSGLLYPRRLIFYEFQGLTPC
jgi:hypothetical protein